MRKNSGEALLNEPSLCVGRRPESLGANLAFPGNEFVLFTIFNVWIGIQKSNKALRHTRVPNRAEGYMRGLPCDDADIPCKADIKEVPWRITTVPGELVRKLTQERPKPGCNGQYTDTS